MIFGCQNQQPEQRVEKVNPAKNSVDTPVKKIKEKKISTADLTLRSTVAITMQDKNRQTLSLGSGAIVGKGMIITNLHFISDASFGFVQLSNDNEKHNIEGILAIDELNDLALLKVPTLHTHQIKLQTGLPKVGDAIFTAGNPQGLSGTFSQGIVSSLRQFENKELIQISAPISPGSSGGPVVNEKAELLGIAVGTLKNGQNLNFAVPAKYISAILNTSLKMPKPLKGTASKQSSNKETYMRDGLEIRNPVWSDEVSNIIDDGTPILLDFSILNNTPYPVSDIRLLLILYDKTNTPVDYSSVTIYQGGKEKIVPGLAKTIINSNNSRRLTLLENRPIKLIRKKGYTCEIRVLDFKIYEDY